MHSPLKSKFQNLGQLYIVATPIGNLGDITYRAVEVLSNVDIILCENTKNSHKLLSFYGINTKSKAYNDHSSNRDHSKILELLLQGKNIALISDAGTPLISDPGYKLVELCKNENIKVIPIPGATAITVSLCASAMPTDKFLYLGFLPNQTSKLESELQNYKLHPFTMVFYESPKRILNTVQQIFNVMGDRQIVVARELTKMHEEFIRLNCSEFLSTYQDKIFKGEIVLIVAGYNPIETQENNIDEILQKLLIDHSLKSAVDIACQVTNLSRKEIYAQALKLKNS